MTRRAASLALRVLAVAAALFAGFTIAGASVGPPAGPQTPAEQAAAGRALLVVSLLDALVLAWLARRARRGGWPLAAALFLLVYGASTVMAQMESAVFLTRLPAGTLPRLFLMGAIAAAPACALAARLLAPRGDADVASAEARTMPRAEWAWRLALIAAAYAVLYFGFGYFVAWRVPEVRAFYGGTDSGSFMAQLLGVVRDTPWLLPFQLLRGLLWAAIALPTLRLLRAGRMETALAIGAAFSVLMTALLLLPNPFMPEPVRLAHLAETAPSNFLFGVLVGWLLARRSAAPAAAIVTA